MKKKLSRGHFSHKSDEWETPKAFFKKLNNVFNFTLDPCADEWNNKCEKYYTVFENGLNQCWKNEVVFINPPYSKIKLWLAKSVSEKIKHEEKVKIVVLMPARTDTKAFHEYVWDEERGSLRPWVDHLDFIKGRLTFVGAKSPAPFPSMLIVM